MSRLVSQRLDKMAVGDRRRAVSKAGGRDPENVSDSFYTRVSPPWLVRRVSFSGGLHA